MNYKIISTTEAHKMLDKTHIGGSIRIEEITSCAVYKLSSGGAILIPFDSSTSAIFEKFSDCQVVVHSNEFEKIRTGNRFESIKDDMVNIVKTWPIYLDRLSKMLETNIEISASLTHLNLFNENLLRYGKKNIEKHLYVELGIYLSMVLKEIVNGDWLLHETNPGTKYNHFKPVIIDQNQLVYAVWRPMIKSFHEGRKLDIIKFLIDSSIYKNIGIKEDTIVKIHPSEWKPY